MWPKNSPRTPHSGQYFDSEQAENFHPYPPQPLTQSPPIEFDEPPLRMDSPSRLQLDANARALKDKIIQSRAKQRDSVQPQQQPVNVSTSESMASMTASSHEQVNNLLQDVLRHGQATINPKGDALTTAVSAATTPINTGTDANAKDPAAAANVTSSQEEGEISGGDRERALPGPLSLPAKPQIAQSMSKPTSAPLSAGSIKGAKKFLAKEPAQKQNHHRENNLSVPNSGLGIRGSRDRPATDHRGSDDYSYRDRAARTSGARDPYTPTNQDRTQLNRSHRPTGNRIPVESPQKGTFVSARHGAQATKPTLEDVLAVDEDLRLFLKYHDWFDLEKRAEKLQQCRHLAAIDAERAEILAKLKGEQKSTSLSLTVDADAANRTSLAHPPLAFSLPNTAFHTPVDAVGSPYKRPLEYPDEDRRFKVPRTEDRATELPSTNHSRILERLSGDYDYYPGSSGSYPHRRGSPNAPEQSRDAYIRRSPRPPSRDRHAPAEDRTSRRYDSYRGAAGSSTKDRRGPSKGRKLDFGHRGETRFFLVKSFNEENVRHSMQDNLWTTQEKNGDMLGDAYNKCKNVILIFSVNKSKAFQGWARMASAPNSSIPRPSWMNGIHWQTSAPFRVEWMNTTSTGFSVLHQLGPNKLNETGDLPVYVGKDGQELDEDSGLAVIELMDSVEQNRRGRERPGARDRDDGYNRRRESDGEWKGKREPDY